VKEVIRHYLRQLGKNERGATIIEFALVVLLFFTLVFGIVEFGWIFHGYINITNAAREAARHAVVGNIADAEKVANDHLKHLKLQNFNLDLAVEPDNDDENDGANEYVLKQGVERIVIVSGDLPLLIGYFPFLGNTFYLEAKATMMQE